MDNFYIRLARNADEWARGLSMDRGGQNLLDMADRYDQDALTATTPEERDAYMKLAAALRRQVERVRAYFNRT